MSNTETILLLLESSFKLDDQHGENSEREREEGVTAHCNIEIATKSEHHDANISSSSNDITTMINQTIEGNNCLEFSAYRIANVSVSLRNCTRSFYEDPIDAIPETFEMIHVKQEVNYVHKVRFVPMTSDVPLQERSISPPVMRNNSTTIKSVFVLFTLYLMAKLWFRHMQLVLFRLNIIARNIVSIIMKSRRALNLLQNENRKKPCVGGFDNADEKYIDARKFVPILCNSSVEACIIQFGEADNDLSIVKDECDNAKSRLYDCQEVSITKDLADDGIIRDDEVDEVVKEVTDELTKDCALPILPLSSSTQELDQQEVVVCKTEQMNSSISNESNAKLVLRAILRENTKQRCT